MKIIVKKASEKDINDLKVKSWPTWEKEPSSFDWEYDEKETCYIIEGRATIRYKGGPVNFEKGDIVIFPKGLKCNWEINEKIIKHYKFG